MKKIFTVINQWTTTRGVVVQAESYEDALAEADCEYAMICVFDDEITDDNYMIFEKDIRNTASIEQLPNGYEFESDTGKWSLYHPNKGCIQQDVSPPSDDKSNVIQFSQPVTGSTH